jgi:hypothetical protein
MGEKGVHGYDQEWEKRQLQEVAETLGSKHMLHQVWGEGLCFIRQSCGKNVCLIFCLVDAEQPDHFENLGERQILHIYAA